MCSQTGRGRLENRIFGNRVLPEDCPNQVFTRLAFAFGIGLRHKPAIGRVEIFPCCKLRPPRRAAPAQPTPGSSLDAFSWRLALLQLRVARERSCFASRTKPRAHDSLTAFSQPYCYQAHQPGALGCLDGPNELDCEKGAPKTFWKRLIGWLTIGKSLLTTKATSRKPANKPAKAETRAEPWQGPYINAHVPLGSAPLSGFPIARSTSHALRK